MHRGPAFLSICGGRWGAARDGGTSETPSFVCPDYHCPVGLRRESSRILSGPSFHPLPLASPSRRSAARAIFFPLARRTVQLSFPIKLVVGGRLKAHTLLSPLPSADPLFPIAPQPRRVPRLEVNRKTGPPPRRYFRSASRTRDRAADEDEYRSRRGDFIANLHTRVSLVKERGKKGRKSVPRATVAATASESFWGEGGRGVIRGRCARDVYFPRRLAISRLD